MKKYRPIISNFLVLLFLKGCLWGSSTIDTHVLPMVLKPSYGAAVPAQFTFHVLCSVGSTITLFSEALAENDEHLECSTGEVVRSLHVLLESSGNFEILVAESLEDKKNSETIALKYDSSLPDDPLIEFSPVEAEEETETEPGTTPELPPMSSAGITIGVIGDFGSDGSREKAVADLVKSWNPAAIVTVGDNNYPSGSSSTIDKNIGKHYSNYIFPYNGDYESNATVNRFFPALGNHDWGNVASGGNVTGHLNYFTLPNNERYYDVVLGNIHFFIIDSDPNEPDGITSNSIQANWIKNRVQASTAKFQVVSFHHAPYSSSERGPTEELRWPFKAWGVDLVLTGHDHFYERFELNGLAYVINGSGGYPALYDFEDEATAKARNTPAVSKFQDNTRYGAIKLVSTNQTLTVNFISSDGVERDTLTITR